MLNEIFFLFSPEVSDCGRLHLQYQNKPLLFNMKENNENKAKALEENKKNYSSENSTPQNGEDIISNEDAEKLEGGIKHEDLERPSEGSLGGIICCNG